MIGRFASISVFGHPLFAYLGLLALLLLMSTALVGRLNFKGVSAIPFKWHPRLAAAAIITALVHAILGLSLFFNF